MKQVRVPLCPACVLQVRRFGSFGTQMRAERSEPVDSQKGWIDG